MYRLFALHSEQQVMSSLINVLNGYKKGLNCFCWGCRAWILHMWRPAAPTSSWAPVLFKLLLLHFGAVIVEQTGSCVHLESHASPSEYLKLYLLRFVHSSSNTCVNPTFNTHGSCITLAKSYDALGYCAHTNLTADMHRCWHTHKYQCTNADWDEHTRIKLSAHISHVLTVTAQRASSTFLVRFDSASRPDGGVFTPSLLTDGRGSRSRHQTHSFKSFVRSAFHL